MSLIRVEDFFIADVGYGNGPIDFPDNRGTSRGQDRRGLTITARCHISGRPAGSGTAMSEAESIVFIVDDDTQVRTSLANLCRSVDLEVEVFSFTDEFLRRERANVPACLVLDIRFPGSAPSGLEFQRKLVDANNPLPIIFITGHSDVPMSFQAMKYGAIEFLMKPVREQELLDAVRHGIERDRRRRDEEMLLVSLRIRFELLTVRERQIMELVARGLLNKQIAAELGLSEVTVKVHRGHVMQKMEARSLAELVRMSDRLGNSSALGAPSDTKV
jgi:FixJ family two-component response regulator